MADQLQQQTAPRPNRFDHSRRIRITQPGDLYGSVQGVENSGLKKFETASQTADRINFPIDDASRFVVDFEFYPLWNIGIDPQFKTGDGIVDVRHVHGNDDCMIRESSRYGIDLADQLHAIGRRRNILAYERHTERQDEDQRQ